jgi:hypothetical protein
MQSEGTDEIKRRLRSLKKLEIKIRFGGSFHAANFDGVPCGIHLVWDEFFHMDGDCRGKARYSLRELASMPKEEYKNIVEEYFFQVYYRYYSENGITGARLYDPEILGWMGLPPGAGPEEIKKRFRELAKKYHPDTGGEEGKFIELMDHYNKLVE